MKIYGFDLDGVIYDWHKAVYKYLKRYHNEDRLYETFWKDAVKDDAGYSKMFWYNLVHMERLYEKYPAKWDVVNALQTLGKDYVVVYITSRPAVVRTTTKLWLDRYNLPQTANLVHTQDPKHLAVRYYGCDYYVEDKIEHIKSPLRNVTNLYVMKQPWNEDYLEDVDNITIIEKLSEIL